MQGRSKLQSFFNVLIIINALALCGLGLGTRRAVAMRSYFVQGTLRTTERELDVGIEGHGFFKVQTDTGEAYTRNGDFVLDKDGHLVVNVGDGYRVLPAITLPLSATGINIAQYGVVYYTVSGSSTKQKAGQLQLTKFTNPDGLRPIGHGLFLPGHSSGPSITGNPDQNGTSIILQGFLEDKTGQTFPVQD